MTQSNPPLSVLGSAGHTQTWLAVGRDCVTPEALRLLLPVSGNLKKLEEKANLFFSLSVEGQYYQTLRDL